MTNRMRTVLLASTLLARLAFSAIDQAEARQAHQTGGMSRAYSGGSHFSPGIPTMRRPALVSPPVQTTVPPIARPQPALVSPPVRTTVPPIARPQPALVSPPLQTTVPPITRPALVSPPSAANGGGSAEPIPLFPYYCQANRRRPAAPICRWVRQRYNPCSLSPAQCAGARNGTVAPGPSLSTQPAAQP